MVLVKIICFLFALIVIVQAKKIPPEEREIFMMFTKNCREQNNATEADMEIMMEGKVPETMSAKCTMTCTMIEFKIIKENDDGHLELLVENIVAMTGAAGLPAEHTTTIREVGEKCKSFEIENECDFSAELGKCFEKEALARGISLDDL